MILPTVVVFCLHGRSWGTVTNGILLPTQDLIQDLLSVSIFAAISPSELVQMASRKLAVNVSGNPERMRMRTALPIARSGAMEGGRWIYKRTITPASSAGGVSLNESSSIPFHPLNLSIYNEIFSLKLSLDFDAWFYELGFSFVAVRIISFLSLKS